MKIDRQVIEILKKNTKRTKSVLAKELGVDPRTVQRCIRNLKKEGIEIEIIRGRNGGYVCKR